MPLERRHFRRPSAGLAAVVAILLGAAPSAFGETIVFVDQAAAPGGHGESWVTAIRWLQDALVVADENEDVTAVHVAQGVYAPDEGESVIAGDRRASFRILSGISIIGGFAGLAGEDPDERDPGRFPSVLTGDLSRNDGPDFANFDENSFHVVRADDTGEETVFEGFTILGGNADGFEIDERAAALLILGGEPILRDLVCRDSIAFLGGAVYVESSVASLAGVLFDGNRATFGGAIYADRADLVLGEVEFRANAALNGGGLYTVVGAPSIGASLFIDNDADFDGGAVYANGGAPVFTDCEFRINTARFDGGALFTSAGAPLLERCVFITNFADEGAAVRCVGGAPMLATCTFTQNFARRGGGLHASGVEMQLLDCLFDRNEAEFGGGAFSEDGNQLFTACAFEGNESSNGGGFYGAGGRAEYALCTFDGNEGGQRGGGVAMIDGDVGIFDCSFNANDASGFFVSNGGAVELVSAGDSSIERTIFFRNIANFGAGVAIEGDALLTDCQFIENDGFLGGGMNLGAGAATIDRCTFRANTAEGAILASGGGAHLFGADSTFRDCVFEGNFASTTGGGLHSDGGSPAVIDCTFTANLSGEDGGGFFATAGDPSVTGAVFIGNEAGGFGGGVSAEEGNGSYIDCVFAGNSGAFGGGMMGFSGSTSVVDCVFTGNTARGATGEQGCTSGGLGGGLASIAGVPEIINCTFSANTAECDGDGGGVGSILGRLTNCVLWGNSDGGGTDESAQVFGAAATVNYCCVQGLTGDLGGEGNIGLDPIFVDPVGPDGIVGTIDDDLRLAPGSTCIDAGNNAAVPPGVTTDVDGLPRFVDDPATIDTGAGAPPLVDLGASEFQAGACPGDLDGDADVDFADLVVLLGAWGPCAGDGVCTGDVNDDGVVDFGDVLIVLGAWGACA